MAEQTERQKFYAGQRFKVDGHEFVYSNNKLRWLATGQFFQGYVGNYTDCIGIYLCMKKNPLQRSFQTDRMIPIQDEEPFFETVAEARKAIEVYEHWKGERHFLSSFASTNLTLTNKEQEIMKNKSKAKFFIRSLKRANENG